jgi:iron complex transport system ATP-binding protein
MSGPHSLRGQGLTVDLGGRTVLTDVSVEIPERRLTAIIGPNASGKSTLLRTLARLVRSRSGVVLLDGADIHSLPTREVARRLGLLPQRPTAPEGMTVAELVHRARYPHRRWYERSNHDDRRAVEHALISAGVEEFADQPIERLSGGQQQRAWIAMTLAQETDIVLFDEPTTYLDLAHQLEVMELLRSMSVNSERTVVAVLHDLQQAGRFADHILGMKHGRIVASGTPAEVLTAEVIGEIFDIDCEVLTGKATAPIVVPLRRR